MSDRDVAAARRLAASIGGNVASGTKDEIIRPDILDAVHVCTPAGHYVDACTIAIERGLHVLCEKPIAETAAETQSLFGIARERKVVLCPVHQFPFQRGASDAAANLTSIGRIRWITAEMCTAGAATFVDSLHDGIALDIVPHPLSLIYAFLGGELSEGSWTTPHPEKGEILVSGVVRETGIAIILSTHGRPTSNSMRLIGERGTISLDLFHGFSVMEGGRVSRIRKFTRPFAASGRLLSAASANAARRGIARETEFPGLTELCRKFYLAADKRDTPPISATEAIDIATARDLIIASLPTPD